MKLLLICTVPFSMTGIPIHIKNYYCELKKKENCNVDICAPEYNKNFLDSIELCKTTEIYTINRTSGIFNYFIKLRKIIRENNYDIVHIHGNSSTMSLELFACIGIRNIKIVHAHNTSCSHKIINILLKPFLKCFSNYKFACSIEAGDWLYGKKSSYTVINNGIDADKFYYSAEERKKIRKQYSISDECFIIGHVGSFNEQKNHDFILNIAENLSHYKMDFKVFLVGDGAEKERFKHKTKQLSLEKYFIFMEQTKNIGQYYSVFDIFILPSKWEGFGMVAVEAQISGLPCIVSEFVSRSIDISKKTIFLKLDNREWEENIYNIYQAKNRTRYNCANVEFDIKYCADKLYYMYLGFIENNK